MDLRKPERASWNRPPLGRRSGTFEIRDDGSILAFYGRLTSMWSKRPGEEEKVLLDSLLIANAHRILLWAAEVGTRIGYGGAWDIGVAGNGLQEASSSAVETGPTRLLPMEKATYQADTFQEILRATKWDIEHNAGALVDRLVGRVLRAVATTKTLSDLAR